MIKEYVNLILNWMDVDIFTFIFLLFVLGFCLANIFSKKVRKIFF